MSLRHAFKSRFLDSKGDSDVVVKGFRSLEKEEEAKMTCSFDDDEEPTECMSSVTEETRDSDHKSKKMDESTKTASVPDDSVAIYESQLTQLQEQLVETMIENQNLKRELELMKDADKVKKLEKNLEIQTGKNKYLARKLEVLQRMRDAELKSQWVDLSEEATETFAQVPEDTVPEAEGWFGRIKTRLFWTFYDILDDFREEETNDQEIEEEPLAVKKLKKNVKRFGNSFKEILSTIKGLNLLLSWKSPAKTLLVFLSYLYFLSMGWILPGILFLMVFRLFISYLQYKGFRIELHYFRVVEDKDDSEEKELGVADKFNIVVQVATKVQNTLGLLADQMEKLKNLLTWQEPEQTQRLFGVLIALFIASCLLPGRIFFFIAGLQVGFKLFIQDPIFNRFPRVKEKYDTVYKMWKILPTDDQLQKRDSRAKMLKFVLEPSPSSSSISATSGSQTKPAVDFDLPATGAERAFQELFSLPVSEVPLPDWKSGRKCVLIDKGKSITSSLAHGKMYLTKSFLCFENSRNPEEHINIPLSEITRLIKAKPFSWMPGSGMSLEITVKDKDKPYIFGGILHRDAVYKSIIKTAKDAHLDWALDVSANKTSSVLSLSSLRAAEDQ